MLLQRLTVKEPHRFSITSLNEERWPERSKRYLMNKISKQRPQHFSNRSRKTKGCNIRLEADWAAVVARFLRTVQKILMNSRKMINMVPFYKRTWIASLEECKSSKRAISIWITSRGWSLLQKKATDPLKENNHSWWTNSSAMNGSKLMSMLAMQESRRSSKHIQQ